MNFKRFTLLSVIGIVLGTLMSSSMLAASTGAGIPLQAPDFRPILILLGSLLLFFSLVLIALLAAVRNYHPPTDEEINQVVDARRRNSEVIF